MNVRVPILLAALAAAPMMARAQGFAGLGADAEGFLPADPGYVMTFPRDHAAHPGFRIEWWYVTANLQDAQGQDYGAQWTLFRAARAPGAEDGWESPVVWIGHAAVTSAVTHLWAEHFERGGTGAAGAGGDPFEAWLDDWEMRSGDAGIGRMDLRASGEGFAYDLSLAADGPVVLQGQRGYSVKSPDGEASHYYSQPFYNAEGTLTFRGQEVAVTGTAWLDREWSGRLLSAGQSGWDWMGLSFDDGARLMVAQVQGQDAPFRLGSWIAADGTVTALAPDEIALAPGPGEPPLRWTVSVPRFGVEAEVTALNPGAWTGARFRYWEGPVRVTGSRPGRGYLEMTGGQVAPPSASR